MIRFQQPEYPGGRHVLMCGNVAVGAVFPPVGSPPNQWRWRVWTADTVHAPNGRAKSELAAKNAALSAFEAFLRNAQLAPISEVADAGL